MCVCFDRFTESHKCLFCSVEATLLLHALNLAFAKIPIGGHTVCACVAASFKDATISLLMKTIFGTIIPFEAFFVAIIGLILGDILFGAIKIIPLKDKRTGQTKTWAIGTYNYIYMVFDVEPPYADVQI